MNRLQFATLLSWAGDDGVKGRKRLQKVVFILKQIGCDLDSHYILHHYGPYSRDVANICDEMVAADLIDETLPEDGVGSYDYKLKPQTKELLRAKADSQLKAFEADGKQLLKEPIWNLELGSTILYFHQHGSEWETAITEACEFKKVKRGNEKSLEAIKFAKKFASNKPTI